MLQDTKIQLKIMENIDDKKLQYLIENLRKIEGFEFDISNELDQSITSLNNDNLEITDYITPTIMPDTEGIIVKYIQKYQNSL